MRLCNPLAAACVAAAFAVSSGCTAHPEPRAVTPSPPAVAADYPGITNSIPVLPAAGETRPGTAYSVYIQSPGTGDKVAFTVFEPTTVEGGKTYPLVLTASGFGLKREMPDSVNTKPMTDAGMGVISFDHRGHGESGGQARTMDPDVEGKNLLAIVDWAEAKLGWLAYRPSGADPHNLVLGSVGGSYGGMYQMLLRNIDPKERLDAMVIWVAPNDLTNANFPGGVPKTAYMTGGLTPGGGPPIDPYIVGSVVASLKGNRITPDYADFLYYHSNAYFCGDRTVATNGGPATAPQHAPERGPKVSAIIYQGMRDTLFPFNEGYANYQCLKREGGDVRLLSYQSGHNVAGLVPDPGVAYMPEGNAMDGSCGSLHLFAALPAFLAENLLGIPGAANAIPKGACFSIAKDDGVVVAEVMTRENGATAATVPATQVVAGTNMDQPIAIELGITGALGTSVIAGIPHVQLNVQAVAGQEGEPILFLGLGQTHNSAPGVWDLVDNQVMPIRGAGIHDVDLIGVATRLKAGEKLALLVYGRYNAFKLPDSSEEYGDFPVPAVVPVTVSGTAWVPLLAEGSYQPAP